MQIESALAYFWSPRASVLNPLWRFRANRVIQLIAPLPVGRHRILAARKLLDLYASGTSIMQLIARTESPINLAVAFRREIKKAKLTSALDESHPKSAQSLA